MSPAFDPSLTEHDEAISATLATFFDDRIKSARAIHPRYELLWRELARVSQNGGKRLRPKITLLTYEAFGGERLESLIPVAAAQEILHASLLIHDDIMDRELTRRGELNISGIYHQVHYDEVGNGFARRHYSESAALLGGDLLLAATFQLMNRSELPIDRLTAAQNVFQRIIFEVAGGQLLDSEGAFLRERSLTAELIARYKTSSYTFVGPLLIGGVLAGANDEQLAHLETFAQNIGVAFQLNDDVIGLFGDEKITGKSTNSDLREGKMTYLVEQFLAAASPADVAAFRASFGHPELSDMTAQSLKSLVAASQALPQTEARIDEYVAASRAALDQLRLTPTAREQFETIIKLSVHRLH